MTAIPRVVIAAPASGSGKSTIASGLMAAYARHHRVQGFKVGPDYIDPMYHTLATGRPSRNLDTWMVPQQAVLNGFVRAAAGADLAVIEGVMGLFDGSGSDPLLDSTAGVARLLRAPIVLVVDCSAMSGSVAALVHGFHTLIPDLPLAGVICNRVGGAQHGAWLTDAIARVGLPVLGLIPAMAGLAVPERHLGLFTAAERPEAARRFIDHAAEVVAAHIDLEALWALARSAPELGAGDAFEPTQPTSSSVRLAVARDEAFCFYYEDNLDLLRQAGAEIVPFSPIRDECLPDDVCGVYLGGGYPELYAPQLAANTSLRRDLLTYHRRGLPMYAECGGLMVLTEGIDLDTGSHDLVGALPGRSTMARGLTMGYREVEVARPGLLGDAGQRLRGHEFHYSAWTPDREHEAYRLATRGPGAATRFEGYAVGRLLASYVHVHFGQDPALPERLVSACRQYQAEQTARVDR